MPLTQSGHLPWIQPSITQRTVVSIKLIQRGTIVFTTESSKTAAITTVDTAKSYLMHLGAEGTGFDSGTIRLALTNSSTITATRQGTGSGATVGYQVVETY